MRSVKRPRPDPEVVASGSAPALRGSASGSGGEISADHPASSARGTASTSSASLTPVSFSTRSTSSSSASSLLSARDTPNLETLDAPDDTCADNEESVTKWILRTHGHVAEGARSAARETFHILCGCYARAYDPSVGNVWKMAPGGEGLIAVKEAAQNMLLAKDNSGTLLLEKALGVLFHLLPSLAGAVSAHPQGRVPVNVVNPSAPALNRVRNSCVYARTSPRRRSYWGETGSGSVRHEQHAPGIKSAGKLMEDEKRAYPDVKAWDCRAMVQFSSSTPATFRHIAELVLCALTSSTGTPSALNTRLWDTSFFKISTKVEASRVITFLRSVTAFVRDGGILPSTDTKGCRRWKTLFGHIVPEVAGSWMSSVARGLSRRWIAVPYLEENPIPINSWGGRPPPRLNIKRSKSGRRKNSSHRAAPPTASDADDAGLEQDLVSFGLGSSRLRNKRRDS